MAKYRPYKCPDCSGLIWHLHLLSDLSDFPDRCPLCSSWLSMDAPPETVFVPQAPMIKKSVYAAAVDQSYRRIEEASIARAEEAAATLEDQFRRDNRANPHEGNPDLLADFQRNQVDELKSGLKITNMADPSSMREGDSAAITTQASAAAQRLSIGHSKPGFQMYGGGTDYAPGVGPGHAGARAHGAVTGHQGWVNGTPAAANPTHTTRAQQMIRAGQLGSYTDKG